MFSADFANRMESSQLVKAICNAIDAADARDYIAHAAITLLSGGLDDDRALDMLKYYRHVYMERWG